MKKSILGFVAVLAFGFAGAQTITYDKTTVEYGKVKFDSDGQRTVTVTNTGNKPLIISEVKAGCGCTTPKWSTDPILPGKTSQINIGYNTKLRGAFTRNIEVLSNDPKNERTVLYINGIVEDPTTATEAPASMSKSYPVLNRTESLAAPDAPESKPTSKSLKTKKVDVKKK